MKWQYCNRKHRLVLKQTRIYMWHNTGKCKLWSDSTVSVTESTHWCWNRQEIIIICHFYITLISDLKLTVHMLHVIPNESLYPLSDCLIDQVLKLRTGLATVVLFLYKLCFHLIMIWQWYTANEKYFLIALFVGGK